MALQIRKAKREKVKGRICLQGTSGSGKTLSAIYLGYGLTGDWDKVCLIDTEHERSSLYVDREDDLPFPVGEFLQIPLDPPYTTERYIEAMKLAEEAVGEDGCIIIDSGTHAWSGQGGILEQKEQISTQRGMNDFSAWGKAGKIQNRFVDAMMSLNCHCIMTLRSKTAYVQEVNPETGKSSIRKLGLKPEQRDNLEYEFAVVLDIDKDTHNATIIKDNTFLEAQGFFGSITPQLGKELNDWLSKGVKAKVYTCECCEKKIKPYEFDNGDGTTTMMAVDEIVDRSKETYGKVLCMDCVFAEAEKSEANEQIETTEGLPFEE